MTTPHDAPASPARRAPSSETTPMTNTAKAAAKAAETMTADATANMREFAEQGMDQAKAAYETFKDSAQETVDLLDGSTAALKSGTADINTKAIC